MTVIPEDIEFGPAMTWAVGPPARVRQFLSERWAEKRQNEGGDFWPIAEAAGLAPKPPETFNGLGLWPLPDGRLAAIASCYGLVPDHRTEQWAASLAACIKGDSS